MSTRVCVSTCLLMLALCGQLAFADPPEDEFVSPSDWRKIEFVGNNTFSDQQLREALQGDSDFLIACHPHGKRVDLEQLTQKLLVKGYRNEGFSGAQVQRIESGAPGVRYAIKEGPRVRCGAVQINGAKSVDVKDLTDWLTKPHPPLDAFPSFGTVNGKKTTRWINADGSTADLEDPIWNPGEPVSFDSESKLNAHVSNALKFHGFSNATSIVRIEETAAGTAQLIVDIADQGPHDRINEITLNGLNNNTRDQLLDYIGAKVGTEIDRHATQRMTERLWESARFTKHQFQFDESNGKLTIELEEFPGLPALDEPVSEIGRVFLAARNWLSTIDSRGDDMELHYAHESWSLRCILSEQGTLIQVTQTPNEGEPRTLTFMVDESALLLSHSAHPGKLAGDIGNGLGTLTLTNKFAASPDSEHQFMANVSVGMSSERRSDGAIVRHVVDSSPAAWLPFAYKEKWDNRIVGDHLIAENREAHVKIDARTGEILEMSLMTGELQIEAGLFEKARAEIQAENRGKPNHYRSEQTLTSIAGYLSEPVVWNHLHQMRDAWNGDEQPIDETLNSAVAKLVDEGLFALPDMVLDKFINGGSESDDEFVIPLSKPPAETPGIWKQLAAKLILQEAAKQFDIQDDSWPWQVLRETCLMMLGEQKYSAAVLGEIFVDENNGPLCHATIAYLLRSVGHPAADQFSYRALSTLQPEPFRRDYQTLSDIAGDSLTKTVMAFHSLSKDELESVLRLSRNEELTSFIRAVHAIALPDTDDAGEFWYELSKDRLQATLESMRR